MINPKELRIGNCVNLYEEKGVLVEVESINKHGINLYAAYQVDDLPITRVEFNSDKLFGIELTPEILEEFGFEIEKNFPFLYKKSYFIEPTIYGQSEIILFISIIDFICSFENKCQENCVYNAQPVKHLHQLQNLWYELTGEELQKKSQ